MRVLWVHNCPPDAVSSGVFVDILAEAVRAAGVEVVKHYTGNLRGVGRLVRAAKVVRSTSSPFDLVHAQFGSACGWVASFARGPKLLTLRGTDMLGMDAGGPLHRAHGLACRWLTGSALRSYGDVIVMSNRMRRELQGKFRFGGRVHVIPSGIDLEVFRPIDRTEARHRLAQHGNTAPWVLFSSVQGPSNPIKRAGLARAAFELLRARRPDAELKLLSGRPHDQVPLWVNACDVALLTSTREGWPNIIKEALACNVPFVSTDVSDLREIADVEPGCTVARPTPEALAQGLLAALERSGATDLRRHVRQMELGAVARQLKDLYERVCPACT